MAGPSGPAFPFNFYPRSPCGERRANNRTARRGQRDFYPRSPCGERPLRHCTTYLNCSRFLSTLSLRRATANNRRARRGQRDFYPRSPCGERRHPKNVACGDWHISIHALLAESDYILPFVAPPIPISIHALLAESDMVFRAVSSSLVIFLSTLSLRRATLAYCTKC